MPGYNVALMEMMPLAAGALNVVGAPPARTYTPGRLPRRFTTEGQGVSREFGGREFAGLLAPPESTTTVRGDERISRLAPRFWFDLYFGEHFSFENTFSWSTSDIRYDARHANGATTRVSGALEMRQLTGGARYDIIPLFTEHAQLYARGGYGWLWYRASGEELNGVPSGSAATSKGYLPPVLPGRHWFPNLGYAGLGVEAFSPRRYWLFGLLGYGVRVEYSEYLHKLSYDRVSERGDVTARKRDVATSLTFGW
jgi:hypothetical protein